MKKLLRRVEKYPLSLFVYLFGMLFLVISNMTETAYFGYNSVAVSLAESFCDWLIFGLMLIWEAVFVIGNKRNLKLVVIGTFSTFVMCYLDIHIYQLIVRGR